jgi:hypothetical protein
VPTPDVPLGGHELEPSPCLDPYLERRRSEAGVEPDAY